MLLLFTINDQGYLRVATQLIAILIQLNDFHSLNKPWILFYFIESIFRLKNITIKWKITCKATIDKTLMSYGCYCAHFLLS